MKALKHSAALAALLTGVAGAAAAQVTYDGAVNLGYSSYDFDGADGTALSADFDTDIAFGNGFELGLGLNLTRLDPDLDGMFGGAEPNFDLDNARIAPAYNFGNGLTAGVYFEKSKLNLVLAEIEATSYGLFGEYDFGMATVAAFYGETDVDELDDNTTDWGVSGTYAMGQSLSVAAGYARTTIDMGMGGDADLDLWKLGGAYDFGNNVTVFAGASWGDFEGSDVDMWGLGVSYDVSAYTPIDVITSIEYSQIDTDMLGDSDVWRFGVTLPFGNKGTATAPLSSVAGAAFDQQGNTLFDTLGTAF